MAFKKNCSDIISSNMPIYFMENVYFHEWHRRKCQLSNLKKEGVESERERVLFKSFF